MTLIKNIFKILAVTALFSSANVFAADFLVDTTINDAQGDTYGGSRYEIDKMDIKWAANDLITVDIYTDFVHYNDTINTGKRDIVFGDLLMSTDGGNTPYNYAFILDDRNNDYSGSYYNNKHWDNTGSLTEISSTKTSKKYHGKNGNVAEGEVMANKTKGTGTQSNWSVDNYAYKTGKTDKISFSFNVNGIDAFQNASQLAFSWAMSCANDVVSGVVKVNRATSVPEPATWLLMLLAFGFIVRSRSKRANDFSA